MREIELVNLLAAQAEALVFGTDEEQWLSDYDPHTLAAAQPLMALARLLQRALVPVPTPAPFRSQLRRKLSSGARTAGSAETPPATAASVTLSDRRRPRVWLGAAAVGSVLSLAGLLFFWRRRGYPLPAGDRLKFSS